MEPPLQIKRKLPCSGASVKRLLDIGGSESRHYK